MGVTPRDHPVAQARYRAARTTVLFSTSLSLLACSFRLAPWWSFLLLVALLVELVARLYDSRVLGFKPRKPSPKHMFEKSDGLYTWEEVARHNTDESAWIAVGGRVFDITSFVDRHPGGSEILLAAVGRDATDLFFSYHPLTDVPHKILNKYCIGTLATYEHPVYKKDSGFYKEAAKEVKKYFESTGKNSKDPWGMVKRMTPVYIISSACYYAMYVRHDVGMWGKVLIAIIAGVCQGIPLTGWMHDASHVALGNTERWWWNVGRFSLDYVSGSSMLSWRNQHVLGHHVYTNVMGADPDLPSALEGDPRRLVSKQMWSAVYRWQWLYMPPLYGLLGLKSRLTDLTEVFSQLRNGPIRVNPISVQDYLRMVSSKLIWAFCRFVVPMVLLSGVTTRQLAVLFLVQEFVTGYWLAFNFQVSHVSDAVEFLYSDQKKRERGKCPAIFEMEWAESQIKTTIDYGHNDPVATYFSGALNYQTIHHLFPSVSQVHYPALTPIVMKVAAKYGYKFTVFNSFGSALGAHISHLKNLGKEGKPAEFKME